jgi:hypothetical protein
MAGIACLPVGMGGCPFFKRMCRPGGWRVTRVEMAPEYAERYVAFIDILGFRAILSQLESGTLHPSSIKALLRSVHRRPEPAHPIFTDIDVRSQSISDAVVISSAITEHSLDRVLSQIRHLACDLLQEGFFIRGAICRGRLYHDDETVFGDGLVRAYELESQLAKFPRILVAEDVRSDMDRERMPRLWKYHHNNPLKKSDDGLFHLNILSELEFFSNVILQNRTSPMRYEMLFYQAAQVIAIGAKMRAALQQQYIFTTACKRTFEKVKWFATYWNETIPAGIPGLEPIGIA